MSNQPFVSDYIQGQRYMIARIAAKTKEAQEKEEKAQEPIKLPFILRGQCECGNSFERRYATQRGVKNASTRAGNKGMSCCPHGWFRIKWLHDLGAQEEIVNQATNIVNQSKEM
jgi:hypothetical protein